MNFHLVTRKAVIIALLAWLFPVLAISGETGKWTQYTSKNDDSSTWTSSNGIITTDHINSSTVTSPEVPCHFTNLTCLYSTQTEAVALYRSNQRFVQLSKWNGSNEMLLFGSIFVTDQIMADFSLLELVHSTSDIEVDSNLTYRVVVKVDTKLVNSSNISTAISLNRATYIVQLSESNLTEWLIPDTLHYDRTLPVMKAQDGEFRNLINHSYVMLCVNSVNMSTADCDLVLNDLQVTCYCSTQLRGFAVVVFEMAVIWIIFAIILICSIFRNSESVGPEVQFNIHMCMAGRSTHEYLVIFRVGPATDGFDFEHNYLDLQLLSQDDQPVGMPIRFSCDKISDPICFDLHMVVCRISPLPPITAIRAQHSDSRNLLHLHDFTVINLRENYMVMQVQTIGQFISSEPVILRPKPSEASQVNANNRVKGKSQLETNWLPFISTWSLTLGEKIIISFLVVGLVSAGVMATRIYLHWYQHWKEVSKSMGQFFLCLCLVSALCLVVILLLMVLYARCVKRPYLVERFKEVTSDENYCLFRLIRVTFLLLIASFGIGLSSLVIYWSLELNTVSAFIWSGINLTIVVLTVGIWITVQDCLLLRMKASKSQLDYTGIVNCGDTLCAPTSAFANLSSDRSTYIPLPSSNDGFPGKTSILSSYGPKMTNPNLAVIGPNYNQIPDKNETDLYQQFIKARSTTKGELRMKPILTKKISNEKVSLTKLSADRVHSKGSRPNVEPDSVKRRPIPVPAPSQHSK